jgi:hypothetical protein
VKAAIRRNPWAWVLGALIAGVFFATQIKATTGNFWRRV